MIKLTVPLSQDEILKLKSGDEVLLSGVIYTARDAAHKRILEDLQEGKEPPFKLENSVIYYVGPAPAMPGQVIGSAGPTSSYRMDPYSIILFKEKARISIGKGDRGQDFKEKLHENQGIYFSAIGGAAALISRRIKKCDLIAYPELGAEAVYRLEIEDFPVIVTYDAHGGDLFQSGRRSFIKR